MPSKKWLFRKIFSDTETQIIDIIGDKKLTITQITKAYYKKRAEKPKFNAGNWIGFVVRQITAKCKYNSLSWTLEGEGMGRHGRTVWRAKTGVARGT